VIRQYAAGELEPVPQPLFEMYPASILSDVEGKDVLCLASGGGQQSAVFGLLGARVTVADFAEGQLEGDRAAAKHYGYEVTTVRTDMRDLSCLGAERFDLVYQAPSMCYIPDVREVYVQVAKVLKPGGLYRACHADPATEFVDWNSWDGTGYRITMPYSERVEKDGSIQFRHHMSDIFNGLIEAGLSLVQVQDDPQIFRQENAQATPGTWAHWLTYIGGFAIVARKG